jgi:hypothetical protein
MCLACFLQVCVSLHGLVSFDESSFRLILVEYEVCFVFVVYWIAEIVEGLEDQVQPRSSEEKHHKKVLILSSFSSLTSLATFKGMSVFKVSTFLSWS